jgi:5-methylcytosine-specific restriction protein A
MPTRALRACAKPGCPTLVSHGRCPEHRTAVRGAVHNGLAYNTAGWRRLRTQVLREEPLCMCEEHRGHDDAPASTVVDHITPHRGDEILFYDRANLRGMAKRCHDRKTSRSDSWNARTA